MGSDLLKNAAPIMLALIVTLGFFGFIYLLFVSPEIPKENAAQLNIILGGVAVVWAKAIGFFYDSSASSKTKDEALSAIAQGATNTGNGSMSSSIPAKDVNVKAQGDVTIASSDNESIVQKKD